MKKVVSFQKEIPFQTDIAEITSISLEHNLQSKENYHLKGDYIISGDYKITDSSTNTEPFHFSIPFDIELDDHYLLDQIQLDISDFYYEIKNENTFVANIEMTIDGLREKPLMEVREEKVEPIPVSVEEKIVPVIKEQEDSSAFDQVKDDSSNYSTYHIYIVREGDQLENILINYHVTREDLEPYNDLNELKVGDKLIIPDIKNE